MNSSDIKYIARHVQLKYDQQTTAEDQEWRIGGVFVLMIWAAVLSACMGWK